MDIHNRCMIEASGNFLTEAFPNNWEDMEDDDLMKFITGHAWEPFQDYRGEDIFEYIESCAYGIESLFKSMEEARAHGN